METDKKTQLFKKLVNIRESIEYLQKTEIGNQGAMYVDSAILIHKIKNELDEKNILLFPSIINPMIESISDPTRNNSEAKSWFFKSIINFTFIDADSEETLIVPWFSTGKHLQDPAMAGGSALTYFERYFLLKFFLIPTAKDDPEFFESKTSEKVSKEQIEELEKIITQKGYLNTKSVLSKYAAKIENILKIEELPASKFESSKKFFEDMKNFEEINEERKKGNKNETTN